MATQVGEAVVKLTFDGSDVTASLEKVSSQMEKTASSSGKGWGSAWSVAAGSLISKGVSTIANTITSHLDGAIARVDTLANAKQVFEAMGYSAQSAADMMADLDTYLDGLPTSSNEAVSGIQQLAASFGGLETGTKVFKAMNDAGLAFGATSADIQGAIVQLSQLSLDGPLDAGTWNSLQDRGFGPVLTKMAEMSGMTTGQLKEDFGKTGTKTVQDFIDMLTKMDTEGGAGMTNLAELARTNTNGIGTAIENVSNRINKAIAKVIDAIGQENISDFINSISGSFSGIADKVVGFVQFVIDNKDTFIGALQVIGPLIAGIFATFAAVDLVAKIVAFVTAFNPLTLIIGVIIGLIVALIANFDKIKPIIDTIAGAIGSFFAWIGSILGGFVQLVGQMIENIKAFFAPIVDWLFSTIIEPIASFVGGMIDGIIWYINQVLTTITTIAEAIWNFIEPIVTAIGTFIGNVIGGIVDVISGIVNTVSTVVKNIKNFFETAFNAVGSVVSTVFDAIKTTIKNIFNTIANIIKTPINAIIGGINAVLSQINKLKIPDWVPGLGGKSPNFGMIPELAQGGYARGTTSAIIGEAGKEVVLPLENNTDNWAGLLASELEQAMTTDTRTSGGRQIVVNMTNEINNEMDAADIGRLLMQSIRRSA